MAQDDGGREIDDTSTIAGGEQAWSAVDRAGDQTPPTSDDAPTEVLVPAARTTDADATEAESTESDPTDVTAYAPTDGPHEVPVPPPAPVLVATGLGLLANSGWVFKDIDLTLRPASVAAIVGPAGTGRSCLLLALSGRMEPNSGTLIVAGHSMRDKPARVRAITSVARIGTLAGPEPGLTVRESVDERCLLEDVDAKVGRARYEEACAALQFVPDPTARVATLIGDQATLFAVALACVRVSALIVLDDLDRGISAARQQTTLDALTRLARTGPTIVVSTTDRIPVMEADVVLDLTPRDGAMVWHFEPAAALPGGVLEQIGVSEQIGQVGDPGGPTPAQLGPAPLTSPRPEPEPDGPDGPDGHEADTGAPTEDAR